MMEQMKETSPKNSLSAYKEAKSYFERRRKIKLFTRDYIFIALGILSAGFGLKSFLMPNHFIDGGATGISLLLTQVTGIPLSALLIIINAPFVILGFKIIGKTF